MTVSVYKVKYPDKYDTSYSIYLYIFCYLELDWVIIDFNSFGVWPQRVYLKRLTVCYGWQGLSKLLRVPDRSVS